MRMIRRFAAITLAAALTSLGLLPTEPAAANHEQPTVTISDPTSFEYTKRCIFQATCNQRFEDVLPFHITLTNRPPQGPQIDIEWELVDVTTTAGADYTGPTSGILTDLSSFTFLHIPLVDDGVGEPTETVELRITSITDTRYDISDVGVGTIDDGAQIPEDCDLAYINGQDRSLTCTDRPAGQDWHLAVWCVAFGFLDVAVGNTVTGNGTSTAHCVNKPPNTAFFILE